YEAFRDRRPPPLPVLLALGAATLGCALLVLPGGEGHASPAGVAWGLLAAVTMAADTVLAEVARKRGVGATPLLCLGLLVGSLALLATRPTPVPAEAPSGD